jgi:hypothetical protein
VGEVDKLATIWNELGYEVLDILYYNLLSLAFEPKPSSIHA